MALSGEHMFGYRRPVPRAPAPTILHADLDAFYASVEQLLDPGLRRRPIAVGGGVVLAASYEARAFGVSAGMSGGRARRLCPGLTFVPGHFEEYQRLGERVIDVLRSFTPLVERVSIDEAFLDVAGALHLFGSPGDIATAVRRRVHGEIGLADLGREWPGPSTWPRWRPRWPSPTGWSSSRWARRRPSSSTCRSG